MICKKGCRSNLGDLIWTTERLPQFDWSRGFAFPFNDTLVINKFLKYPTTFWGSWVTGLKGH